MANRRTIIVFLRHLGIHDPTDEQIDLFTRCNNFELAFPIAKKMIAEGKASQGDIAKEIGVTVDTIKHVRRKIAKSVSRTPQTS